MRKHMVPKLFGYYCKTHGMGKPIGAYMAKPIVFSVAESYGKTHSMGKAIGVSMVKVMGPKS